MYMWRTISSVCVTLWILQRLIRLRGEGNAVSKKSVVHIKSKGARKIREVSVPSIGTAECKPHQYDVFINHRGPDVKKTFVAHLNGALRRDGFRPFLDAKDIGQGRHVFKSIDKALKGACVHVAVFSKRHAESKYCLNELCGMLKSEQVILPVFYGVCAEDLRWIDNGPFKADFQKHVNRGRIEEVQKWKEALRKTADIRGFRLDEVNGNEDQLIRSILVEIRRLVPVDVLPGKQRYGMAESMINVLRTLDSVSVLGLVGAGGIGKTTLAMEIYNHFVSHRQFERYCFLKDVRSSEPSQLQRNLMCDLGHHSEVQNISPQEYQRLFDALICQRVLIIVDDIDNSSQFSALIPDIQRLGSGSRMVITSRQRDVLNRAMAATPCRNVYVVPFLNKSDSRHLFNRHAFLSDTPSPGFADLAAKVADTCGGHALSLETIGASLFDKKDPEDREIWMESVKALQENDDIFGKLRSTYDSLPTDGDRTMFRDIACMLIGMEKEVALTIWRSCNSFNGVHCDTSKTPALVLRRLVDRSLVKLDREGRLSMHDVLRDMGRDILKKEARRWEERTHLWEAATAMKVLSCRKNNINIRGIRLAVREGTTNINYGESASIQDGAVSCEASLLTSMKELHLLILDGCKVVPDDFSSWPRELRLLQWRSFCFSSLPSQLELPSLVVLDLSCSDTLTLLWENDAHIQLPLLQTLDLSRCKRLEELAENVGQSLPKLKRLLMGGCLRLRRLPDSIGHLTDLEHLDLRGCPKLVILPDPIVRLISLKTLILYYCHELQQLPDEFGKLTNLETLDVACCFSLSELPASIGGLKMLRTLKMQFTKVKDFPVEFGLLTSLTSLSMPGPRSVPITFQGLQALTVLHLQEGSADLPDLAAFTALKVLKLWWHATITALPRSLGNLMWLVRLVMERCLELLTVEALPEGLEHLELSQCPKLTEIPGLGAMRSLVHLKLHNCMSLRHIFGLECLTTLEYIDVSGCSSMEGCRICSMENRALRECYLSGSKVSVAYNNKWLERDPAEQVISWVGGAIPFLPNGIADQLVLPHFEWTLVVEATILSKAECIAVIGCLVTQSDEWYSLVWFPMKIEIWRGRRLVMQSRLVMPCRPFSEWGGSAPSEVHLWTLRREHLAVQSLQHGDQICIYLNAYGDKLTVVGGAVCVVHNEDQGLILTMNSEALSASQSKNFARQFGELVCEDRDKQLVSTMN